MNKDWENLPRKMKEEKITNRVLLNFGYTLLGYILLYILYLFAMGRIGIEYITSYGYIMLGILCVTLLAMITFYVVGHIKSKRRWTNYGHMMLGISVAAFYLNLAFYIRWLPIDLPGFLNTAVTFLRNTRNAYIVTAIAMLIYLVIVIVYNSVLLYKKPAAATAKKKASKKRKH